jgi:SAM-dependent methyltransferase
VDRERGQARPLSRSAPPRSAYRDKELEAGSLAHYDDAAYYDKTYRSRKDDVAYYVELAAKHGVMLEYGAGNGRLALPAARAGARITGVDHSRPMLADFARRLSAEAPEVQKRVTLRYGDMRAVKLKKRFSLVTCPFNAFLHLYEREDVERFLARVREHLAPRGLFVFDVSNPNPHELVRDPNRAYFCPRFRYPRTGEMVRYTERFDYDLARQILFVTMEFLPLGHEQDSWVTPLAHRQFFPRELEALLHYNGFSIDALWGDYKRTPFDRDSELMVVEARVRAARGRRSGYGSGGPGFVRSPAGRLPAKGE